VRDKERDLKRERGTENLQAFERERGVGKTERGTGERETGDEMSRKMKHP